MQYFAWIFFMVFIIVAVLVLSPNPDITHPDITGSKPENSSKDGNPKEESPLIPSTKKHVVSSLERLFLELVEEAAGDRFRIFAKVPLSSLVDMDDKASKRFGTRVLDLVLCDSMDLSVAGVIDLSASNRIDEILVPAGITVLHLDPDKEYTAEVIRKEITRKIPGT